MHSVLARRSGRVVALAAGTLIVGALGCRDLFTPAVPTQASPTPAAAAQSVDPGDPDVVEAPIGAVDPWNGASGTPPSTVIVTYPRHTRVKVVATGFHTRTPNFAGIDTVGQWGPSGNATFSWVNNGQNTTRVMAWGGFVEPTVTVYELIRGDVHFAGRAGYAMRTISGYTPPGGTPIWCGWSYMVPCDTWSGSTTITFTRLNSDLALTPESTTVSPGSTPYFDYRASPTVVEGQNMPFEVDSTHWLPDSEDAGGDPAELPGHWPDRGACQSQYNPACRRKIIGSGTFVMSAWVNGKRITKSTHIEAATLRLEASPARIRAGDSVTFTPTWSDGTTVTSGSIVSWTWTPDALPGHASPCAALLPCRAKIQESGTMKVLVTRNGVTRTARASVFVYSSFSLEADSILVHPGDTVTFTPKYDGVSGPAAMWRWVPDDTSTDTAVCPGGETECKKRIRGPGTMWAYTVPSGGDSASKHISVLPRRRLTLDPSDTVWVQAGSTVEFTASAEGGAIPSNIHWWSEESLLANRVSPRWPGAGSRRMTEANGVLGTTCGDGVLSCEDSSSGIYTRFVTAMVDDSAQTQSVVVVAGLIDPLPEDVETTSQSPCPTCTLPDSAKRANIDSIRIRMDTVETRCKEAFHKLTDYLGNNRIYVYTAANGNWGKYTPSSWLASSARIELWSGLWIPPGKKVNAGIDAGTALPIILTVEPHRMEKTIVHESLHAAGYDHDTPDGRQFTNSFLEPCMNAGSRTP